MYFKQLVASQSLFLCVNAGMYCGSALAAEDSTSQKALDQPRATDSGDPPSDQSKFTSGTDFKTGPVTDDEKLIKPVTTGKDSSDKNFAGGPKESSADKRKGPSTPQKNAQVSVEGKGPVSMGALKVATDLGMVEQISQLESLKRDGVYKAGEPIHRLEVVSIRQDLDETVLGAFFQARRVVSELDREISGYDAVARVLEEKRDQDIRNNNVLNFTSGGALAMTGGALSIGTPMKFQNTGNELAAIAGGVSALISSYALKIQKGDKRDAERDPNMLAPVFGLVPVEPNKYPPFVWNYLSDHEPGQKKNRREQLINRWIKLKYIEDLDKPTSHEHLSKLAGTVAIHKDVTIDLLRDRIPMLEDVRATVAGVNEYLDEVLTFVRKP